MIIMRNKLFIGGVLVLLAIGLGVWAKADADARADDYQASIRSQNESQKRAIDGLNLSKLIGVYGRDGLEDLKTMRQVCGSAESLAKEVQESAGLKFSLGSWLSSKYRSAQQNDAERSEKQRQLADMLDSYAKRCDYYVYSSEVDGKIAAIKKSPAYSQHIYYGGNCNDEKKGCVRPGQYSELAEQWVKIAELKNEEWQRYSSLECPLDQAHEEFCDALVAALKADSEYDETYLAALRSESRERLNATVTSYANGAGAAYQNMNKLAQELDSSAKGANEFYANIMRQHEVKLHKLQ